MFLPKEGVIVTEGSRKTYVEGVWRLTWVCLCQEMVTCTIPLGNNNGYDARDSYIKALGAACTWKFGTDKLHSVSAKIKRCQGVKMTS